MNDAAQARARSASARGSAYAALGLRAGRGAGHAVPGRHPSRRHARRAGGGAGAGDAGAAGVRDRWGCGTASARAQHYVALGGPGAGRPGRPRPRRGSRRWRAPRPSATRSLEGTVYINLGVTYTALGQRAKALDFYRQSYETAERRGDERRAAYSRANAGALLIEYGEPARRGLRFVEGALRVVRRLERQELRGVLPAAHRGPRPLHRPLRRGAPRARRGDGHRARAQVSSTRFPALLLDDGRVSDRDGRLRRGAGHASTKALTQRGGDRGRGAARSSWRACDALLGDCRRSARDALERAQQAAGGVGSATSCRA